MMTAINTTSHKLVVFIQQGLDCPFKAESGTGDGANLEEEIR